MISAWGTDGFHVAGNRILLEASIKGDNSTFVDAKLIQSAFRYGTCEMSATATSLIGNTGNRRPRSFLWKFTIRLWIFLQWCLQNKNLTMNVKRGFILQQSELCLFEALSWEAALNVGTALIPALFSFPSYVVLLLFPALQNLSLGSEALFTPCILFHNYNKRSAVNTKDNVRSDAPEGMRSGCAKLDGSCSTKQHNITPCLTTPIRHCNV